MTLYESNYIRLGWIAPAVAALGPSQESHIAGDCPLRLSVLERGPYTTTLALSYLFDVDGATLSDPDLSIRVYHDARLAEALGDARRPAHAELRRLQDAAMKSQGAAARDPRWARNVMLNKWLEYCAERGHRFAAVHD